jgi:PAS domain S-box-containing protein
MFSSFIPALIITDNDHEHHFLDLFPKDVILHARDVEKIIQIIHDGNPQLIFLSITGNTQQIDKLYNHLKSDEQCKSIPIVLINASESPIDQISQPIQDGAEAILNSGNKSTPTNLLEILSRYFKQVQSLQRSNSIFSNFFSESPIYLFIKKVTATENILLYDSENLLDLNNIPCSQLVGKNISEIIGKENAEEIMKAEWDIVQKNEVCTEERFHKGNYFTSIKFPIFYEEETYLGGFVINTTIQKQTEESLQNSEQHFRSILDNSDAGYFFIDKEGIIQDVNKAWVKLYKYDSAEEIIGQHFTVIQKIDDLETAKEFVEGISNNDPNYLKGEFSRKCKDGSFGFHTYSARPVIKDGSVIGIEGFIIDITEHRQTIEALRASEERYFLIDEASQDMIYSYDINGRLTHANTAMCKRLQLTPDQILGKTHEELNFPKELCDEWDELHRQVYESGGTVIAETTGPIPDGTIVHYEVVLNPIHDAEGNIIGIAGTTRDIQERKVAEKKNKEQVAELKRWYNITMGREERVLELKREVNQLLEKAGMEPKYKSVGKEPFSNKP